MNELSFLSQQKHCWEWANGLLMWWIKRCFGPKGLFIDTASILKAMRQNMTASLKGITSMTEVPLQSVSIKLSRSAKTLIYYFEL
jgi:hypothetical protein